MTKYAIEAKNISKHFGELRAVDDVSLSIKRGQLYALLGPNGSGKTTFIKLCVGLLKPTKGTVKILGKLVPHDIDRHKIGYMPQETAIYRDLTVRDNIAFMGEVYGLSKKQIEKNMDEVLDFVDLKEKADEPASALSGGMKHRTSLACTLISKPRVMILDEPTVGVDPELRANFWDYFDKLQADGITIIITTHYMDEARNCEKVGFLRDGQLIIEGPPKEIMERTGTGNLEDAFLIVARGGGGDE